MERWGKATGMRENMKKREGLAMGALKDTQLPPETKWIKDGEWATSLGNPVGNNIDHSNFLQGN